MKKLYPLLLSSLLVSQVLFSQNLTFFPDDTVDHNFTVNNTSDISLDIINNTSDSITIKWNKISNSLPQDWDYSICDLGTCYTGIPISGTMQKMSTTDTAFLKLTVFHNNAAGQGKVVIRLEPTPGEYDTVVFFVSNLSLGNELISSGKRQFNIYPNPASDKISVTANFSSGEISLSNILGEKIFSSQLIDYSSSLTLSDLPRGLYFLTVQNGEFAETKKVIISH